MSHNNSSEPEYTPTGLETIETDNLVLELQKRYGHSLIVLKNAHAAKPSEEQDIYTRYHGSISDLVGMATLMQETTLVAMRKAILKSTL